jgi:hypothetical protein
VLILVRTDWAIVYSLFYCYSEHFNYYIFSAFVPGLLFNLIKDYSYGFQIKPRVIGIFRGLNSLRILSRCFILLSLLFSFRQCRLSEILIVRGYKLRSATAKEVEDCLSYVRVKIWNFIVRAPVRRILYIVFQVFTNVCLLLLVFLLMISTTFVDCTDR